MNTLKQYLQETKLPELQTKDAEQLFDLLFEIASNIKPFVKAIGGPNKLIRNVLWRGLRTKSSAETIIIKIRKDRKPSDTEKTVSKVVDDWFLKNFKIRFRSEAIFASGSRSFSKNFGTPVVIIPKGNFSFVWSPKVEDLFNERLFKFENSENIEALGLQTPTNFPTKYTLSDLNLDINKLKTKSLRLKKNISDKKIKSIFKNIVNIINDGLNKANYQANNLQQAIISDNEVMIAGEEYYNISAISNPQKNIKTRKFNLINS